MKGMGKARKSARATQRVTIDEVARHAGVSPMTVSRVVNGGKYVRDDTRETVMAAVRTLNYTPNPAARTLAGVGGERIGLLYGNPSAAYLSEFLLGALEESSRSGAQLVLEKCEPNTADSKRATRKLVEGAVAGVILPPPLCESALIRKELQTAGLPIVAVASGRPPADVLSVRVHDYEAAYEMTKYLLDLGHKRFGFIKGHPNQTASEERWRGFQAALHATHEKLPEPQVEQGFFSYRSGLDAAKKLLGGTHSPTAIFASNDDMAAAVVSEAHRLGLDVPRDLSVVGFDNTLIASTVWPELTTVHQPVVEMASQAVAMLLKEIRSQRAGHAPAHEHKVVGHSLITRASAAPPHAPSHAK
jgi:LacI family transcriptional regulator